MKLIGKYISFVDSDDIIAKDMISSLYKCIVSEDAEMAVTGLKSFYEVKYVKRKLLHEIAISCRICVCKRQEKYAFNKLECNE